MKKNIKKYMKIAGISFITVSCLGGIITSSILNSRENNINLFAEIIVSDNTSVLADKSFSESTFNGYRNFLSKNGNLELNKNPTEFREGFGLWRRPGNTNFEREITFKGVFENGKKLIIAPGFNQAQSIMSVLKDPKYNDKGFILLDSGLDPNILEKSGNISTVVFRMEQAGFQCGVAAAEFLNVNEHVFGDDGHLKIGAYVGIPLPSTMDFLIGLQKGMVAWNEANPNKTQIEWITRGTNAGTYASGTFGVGDGKSITIDLLNAQADMIMPIAGPQTLDSINEIIQGDRPVAIIGADSPQENTDSLKREMPGLNGRNILLADGLTLGNNNIIQFSAEKKLSNAVEGILDSIINWNTNNNVVGAYGGFGYSNIIASGPDGSSALGISEAGKDYFVNGLTPDNLNSTFGEVIAGLVNNKTFQEMITTSPKPKTIVLYNTKNGKPGVEVDYKSVMQYTNGLNNQMIDIAPNDELNKPIRLDGRSWMKTSINRIKNIWVKKYE